MKKRFQWLLGLLLACVCSLFALVACEKPSDETPNPNLKLSAAAVSALLGDELKLDATYRIIEGETLSFRSSNESVATIDGEGNVTTLGVGETTLTAAYAGKEAACTLRVWLGNMLPVLQFSQAYGGEIAVAADETLDLSAAVAFNGKTFDDAVLEYELSDKTLGNFQNGVFKPSKRGETALTVSGVWRGVELEPLETLLRVVNVCEIYVNDGVRSAFTLYTIDTFAGNFYETQTAFETHTKCNGEAVEGKTEILSGAEVIELTDGVLFAKKAGEAVVRVSVQDGAETVFKDFAVKVEIPVVPFADTIEFSAADGVLPVETLFWTGAEIVSAYQGATELTVSDNQVLGVVPNILGDQTSSSVNPESVALGTTAVTVYTATAGRSLTLEAYTKLIKTAADLRALNLSDENPLVNENGILYGYFALGANIAYDETWTPNTHSSYKYNENAGFYGVFDGRGYSMDVNMYGDGGLFGRLGRSCVKNVSVRFREQAKNTGTYGFAYAIGAGTWGRRTVFENVEIRVENYGAASWKGDASTVLACEVKAYLSMKNVMIYVDFASGKEEKSTGLLATTGTYGSTITFSNVYVVTARTELPLMSKAGAATGYAANVGQTENVYASVKAYKAVSEMASATESAANGGYAAFSSTYWDLTDGIPVWKEKN